ncbi:MAG: magnesium transporter CorA family protein [Planctomycetes bacterium]|nr:magnesium transporter CorA family protein [Planctomycetota bacterium]
MKKLYQLEGGKVRETACEPAPIAVYTGPDEAEKRYLVEQLKIDEHTLASALDPNELPRLELEPDHAAVILNRPKKFRAEDGLLFRVASTGAFLFADKLVIVVDEDVPVFDQPKFFSRLRSLREVLLRVIYRSTFHFLDHLAAINAISDELEQKVNTSLQNDYLIQLFNLEKSLVYLVSAIRYNGALIERIRHNAAKLGLAPEELEIVDDITIENNECTKQAEIYSNVVAGLMDARVSIVNNNLNQLIKRLNFAMIALMWPTLAFAVFSMNVQLPLDQHHSHWPFWLINVLAFGPVAVAYLLYLRRGKP